MKISRPRFPFAILLGIGIASVSNASLFAHDPEEHHCNDHIRAEQSSEHAREDRDHAEEALDRAYATGNFRDYLHALQDRAHARHAKRTAHEDRDHASRHLYYDGD